MQFHAVEIEKPEDVNLILGQTHFIKTVEDVHECMVNSVPGIKFGMAFCEASGPCLVRHTGTDPELEVIAVKNAEAIGAGHCFIVLMRDAFPLNVLPALKAVPEVCGIFCATANPTTVVVAENDRGRGIMGVVDGNRPEGVEAEEDTKHRRDFLRKIGYKQ